MQAVASKRSSFVTVLLDGVHDPHNIAAVLRSADAFGVRDVHVVESGQQVRISNKVARGTQNWVNLYRYPSATVAGGHLQQQGYQLLVAAAGENGIELNEWMPSQRTAFVFGNEHAGVREDLRNIADGTFQIDMVGMVESLNISVACAITLRHARTRLAAEPRLLLDHADRQALVEHWGASG